MRVCHRLRVACGFVLCLGAFLLSSPAAAWSAEAAASTGADAATTAPPMAGKLPTKTGANTEQALQKMLDATRTKYGIAGALLSTVSAAPTPSAYNLTSGVASWSPPQAPIATPDQFRIGSISKTFVATVVLQLVSEGKFTLDSTLTSLLGAPAVATVPYADKITVHQLLQMTSGIYDYNDAAFQKQIFADPQKPWTPQAIVDSIKGKGPEFKPGASCSQCPCKECGDACEAGSLCFKYSNTNYILLGMVIEKYTGHTLADELDTRILKPLKLTSTSLPSTTGLPGRNSQGYMPKPPPTCQIAGGQVDVTNCITPTSAWAAGGMVSSIPDLSKWNDELISGDLLTPEMQKQRMTFIPGNLGPGFPIEYGLGVMKLDGYIGHGGEFFGYASIMFESPTCKDKIFDLVNLFPEADGRSSFLDIFLAADKILCPANAPKNRALARTFSASVKLNKAKKGYSGTTWHIYQ